MAATQMRTALRWSFGFEHFPDEGPQHRFDGRRRTTKLFNSFRQFANQMMVVNALIILANYLILVHFLWRPILPPDFASLFQNMSVVEYLFDFGRVFLSAQTMAYTLSQLHARIVPIVLEDHAATG